MSSLRKPKPKELYINMQRTEKGMMKKWKSYKFSLTKIYLLYYKSDCSGRPDGQILLSSITRLETNAAKGASYPVQVYFKGKAEHGANSPWVLDLTSNDERMDWMESVLPGSSEPLRRFVKAGSVKQTLPLSPQNSAYNPYSVADHDPDVGNGSPQSSLWQNMPDSAAAQPLNYMDPVPSLRLVGSQSDDSECGVRGSHVAEASGHLAASADGSRGNSRLAPTRSLISRENGQPPVQLNRSNTERLATKSPDHIYELDAVNFTQQSKPPMPSKAPPVPKPRGKKAPPPRVKNLESYSDSQSSNSVSSVEAEPRYAASPRNQCLKEAEFEYPEPAQPRPSSSGAKAEKPPVEKPPVTPRRKPFKQPEYLTLSTDDESSVNGISGTEGNAAQRPSLTEEMMRNFTSDQLDKLITMLQQVQSDGDQQHQPSPTHPAAKTRDSVRRNFKKVVSYTPELSTNKILVTDDDDGEGYEARPDWAKAVSKRASDQSHADSDPLSDLQEEALYISRSRLSDFHVIGEGQFGKVFRAMMKRGSEPVCVAVKTAKKATSTSDHAEFLREMNIMAQMVHPNIVQLFGVIKDDVPAPWIVLEYLHNGDIKHFLMNNQRPVEKLVKYMIDVSMGMHYLSERGLVHRDLAARNVLVGENETCKVSDFGLLRELPKDDSIYHMQTNVPCPVRWMPPESIADREFSPASDVWSFGVLQWEMFYPDKTPYQHLGNIEVAMKIMKGHRLEPPPSCPAVVSRIMKACWHQNPDKRPSFLLISTLLTTKVTFPNEAT